MMWWMCWHRLFCWKHSAVFLLFKLWSKQQCRDTLSFSHPLCARNNRGPVSKEYTHSWCVCVFMCSAVDFQGGCWVLPWLPHLVKTQDTECGLRATLRKEHTLVAMHDQRICSGCYCLPLDFVNWLKVFKRQLLLPNKSSPCTSA